MDRSQTIGLIRLGVEEQERLEETSSIALSTLAFSNEQTVNLWQHLLQDTRLIWWLLKFQGEAGACSFFFFLSFFL